jgi:hypothetical protein
LAANNTWSGTNKFDGEITLSPGGTQDYVIGNVVHTLTIQAQSAGTDADVRLYTFDGDATDSILFSLWGKGTPVSAVNRERLLIGWLPATNIYGIFSENNGTGTLRPVVLYTGANLNQLHLAIDGKVGIGVAPTAAKLDVSGTVHATGAVDFDTTLHTVGAVTFDSSLFVTGAFTAQGFGYIQDNAEITGNLLVDGQITSASSAAILGTLAIGLNAVTTTAELEVVQSTPGGVVERLRTVTANDDSIEEVVQNRVATTDATVTTLHTFTLAPNTTYTLDVYVTARRTAGTGVGLANDGAGVHMNGTYKGMTGTATIVGTLTVVSSHLNTSMAAVTMTVSGATVLVRVTGTASNSIAWHMTARVHMVST